MTKDIRALDTREDLAGRARNGAARIRRQKREQAIETAGPLTALSLIMEPGEWESAEHKAADVEAFMRGLREMYREDV